MRGKVKIMLNENFKKAVDEMTKEDWEDLYAYRSEKGAFYSNSINSPEKLEAWYKLSLKQEETIKKYFEENNPKCKVEFADPQRNYIMAKIENHGAPDLIIDGCVTVEIKNFWLYNYRSNKHLKLNFSANFFGLNEEQMKERIWEKNFHNADLVYFINPECDTICYTVKKYNLNDIKLTQIPDNTVKGKQRIKAYLPVSYLEKI